MLHKNGDTKKDSASEYWKCETIWSPRLAISNGATTLKNAVNNYLYLKDAMADFTKSTRSRLQEN